MCFWWNIHGSGSTELFLDFFMLIQSFFHGNLSGKFRRFEDEKNSIMHLHSEFFSFLQYPLSVHGILDGILSKKTWISIQQILFKMVYLKWLYDWKSVKPRSKSNKISYILIETHKTMLTNSNLTECRKKPISKYVVQFQWNFHVESSHHRKKWKHHIKMHFYDIILCWWNQLLTFKALFINNIGSSCQKSWFFCKKPLFIESCFCTSGELLKKVNFW